MKKVVYLSFREALLRDYIEKLNRLQSSGPAPVFYPYANNKDSRLEENVKEYCDKIKVIVVKSLV